VVTIGPLGPADPETGRDPLPVVTLADVIAQLVRHGSTVAEEFLPSETPIYDALMADGGYIARLRPPPRPSPGRPGWH
jgi:hypothetical protein